MPDPSQASPLKPDDRDASLCALGVAVLRTEAQAVASLIARIGPEFATACRTMLACKGRVVVSGIGKSGHVANKIAATLASVGTPAFFVHAAEAGHGDLGMITRLDVVLVISNSGETDELVNILPMIKRLGVPLISITGNHGSALARAADVNLDVSVNEEACPLGLAPTASTTAALAMGDALAIALLDARGFSQEDFARSHPAGSLGRRLLLHVGDIMRTGEAVPEVAPTASFSEALLEMTHKGLGMTVVIDPNSRRALGVFTDGDLRRALDARVDVHESSVNALMTQTCVTVSATQLAAEGLNIMQARKVNALPVVDDNGGLIGVVGMHDMLQARVV
ncbi:MAG: KpsF/GutQ family sugar-phosphate isomerase [Chromatiales bacterium]|jgi:arabinose-5-phosphate isomerase|nr:KpsF/GutQ family sugar-phosphate isomerase [Chromatiales bacterium]